MGNRTTIDINVGDAVELEAQPEGEYSLLCQDVEIRDGDNGPYLLMRLEIPEILESKGITHVMMLPTDDNDPKQRNGRKLALKRCTEAFGVDAGPPINIQDFVNQEARAYLAVEESDQYGRQNRVRRWVTGAASTSDNNRAKDLALE